jgi:hypothetical protein
MDMFDKLYDVTDDDIRAEKKPLVRDRVLRALAGALDSYADQRIDVQAKINDQMRNLAQGEIKAIDELIGLDLDLVEINLQAEAVKAIKARLTAEVKE